MAYILVQHSVEDFAKWKAVFDEHATARKAAGSRGGLVLHNTDDPNQVTTLLDWDNLEDAQAFASSDTLREAMKRAGVKSAPTVLFLDKAADTAA